MTEQEKKHMEDTDARLKAYESKRNTRITQALMALVGLGILIGGLFLYVGYQQRVSDQRWCALLGSIDRRYQKLPPNADAEARDFADNLHTLVLKYRCKPEDLPTPASSAGGTAQTKE